MNLNFNATLNVTYGIHDSIKGDHTTMLCVHKIMRNFFLMHPKHRAKNYDMNQQYNEK